MEKGLSILGDGLAIAALSIIASVSLSAWNRILPGAKVPMQFGRDGKPGLRMDRKIAVLFMPILATILLFLPMVTQITRTVQNTDEAVILFIMRSLLAGGLAAAHIVHMRHALVVLQSEGQLRS